MEAAPSLFITFLLMKVGVGTYVHIITRANNLHILHDKAINGKGNFKKIK